MTGVHDLHVFMEQVSNELTSEYARIFARAAEDPGTAGDEGEENWAVLLREWLPSNYHVVTKGRIINPNGALTPQMDVLVLKLFYPLKLMEKKIWLAAGVSAAFECKNTLRAEHITQSFVKSAAVARITKGRIGSPYRELQSEIMFGVLAHSHNWKAQSSDPVATITAKIHEGHQATSHPIELPSFYCVSDLGFWAKMYMTIDNFPGIRVIEALSFLNKTAFGVEYAPQTDYIRSILATRQPAEAPRQGAEFRPVSAMIASVTYRLAREDGFLASLDQYFRSANMLGSGIGTDPRWWPMNIYSEPVQKQILSRRWTTGDFDQEWSLTGL